MFNNNNIWSNNLRQNRSSFPPNIDRMADRFTESERYILEMYFSQYNEHLRQIDERYYELNIIRNNIHRIILGTFSPDQNNPRNQANNDLFGNGSSRNSRLNQRYTRTSAPTNTPTNARSSVNDGTSASANANARTRVDGLIRSFFDTIPIRPTPMQITSATNVTSYSNISNPLNTRCPISLEQFAPTDSVTQLVRCGHIFNSIDFAQWFQYNVRCPVCRQDIRESYATSVRANNINANANNNIRANLRNTRSNDESMSLSSSEDETKEENTFQESKQDDDDHEDNSANITSSITANNPPSSNNYNDLIALIFDYASETSESLPISTIDPSGNTVLFEALFRI